MPSPEPVPALPLPGTLDAGGVVPGPPGVLLPPGGPPALARPAAPPAASPAAADAAPADAAPQLPAEQALQLDAERLVRLLATRAGRPPRWTAPAFCREVELVRSHLQPIGSRTMLAASFGRESFHGRATPGTDGALVGSAVRVAYALRWLELDGGSRAPWRTHLEGTR